MRASFFAMLSLLLLSLSALADGPAYRVIVHPSNAATAVDRDFLADAFLKKVSEWPNGRALRPVDLRTDSAVRAAFVSDVLRRSIAAVRSYWQQQIFSGRNVPPPELASDAEVIAFVMKYPGAVGYVSSDAKLDGVKVISVK